MEWVKIIAQVVSGGVAGVVITTIVANSRNKIQPVSRRISVFSVDIPAIMPGYKSLITLSNATDSKIQYQFEKISTVLLEFSNIGNKDFESFDIGIALPENANIIGVQYDSVDDYHVASHSPIIDLDNVSSKVDFVLKPFQRQDKYSITLVVCYPDDDLLGKIKLSKNAPVKFVDGTLIDKELADIISSTAKDYPFGSFYLLPAIVGAKLLVRKLNNMR